MTDNREHPRSQNRNRNRLPGHHLIEKGNKRIQSNDRIQVTKNQRLPHQDNNRPNQTRKRENPPPTSQKSHQSPLLRQTQSRDPMLSIKRNTSRKNTLPIPENTTKRPIRCLDAIKSKTRHISNTRKEIQIKKHRIRYHQPNQPTRRFRELLGQLTTPPDKRPTRMPPSIQHSNQISPLI